MTASLLGVGIPIENIDHPSLQGFLRKYTTMEWSIRDTSALWKSRLEAIGCQWPAFEWGCGEPLLGQDIAA